MNPIARNKKINYGICFAYTVWYSQQSDTGLEQQPKKGRKMSSCIEAKDSLLDGAKELDEGGKKNTKDSNPTGHENTLLPLDELEKELVSLNHCLVLTNNKV